MKKVFVLAPREDWIVDRFVKEWREDNPDITVNRPDDADVIWLLADWCYQQIDPDVLGSKKVITTIHHVVPDKFGPDARSDFALRDRFTDTYHVPNKHTEAFIRPLTSKPIHVIPYWANQKIWRPTGTKEDLRTKYGLPENGHLIGSFQRDTEGRDLISPKLEKGPDLLANYLETLDTFKLSSMAHVIQAGVEPSPLHVVLAGWRRQYIKSQLETLRIPYTYFERPAQETLNELYQTLDLYPVTSRHEGGPQSLIECGLLGIPVVSRDVGMATQVLPASAINDNVFVAIPAVPDVEALKLPLGYEPYRRLIESL